MNGSLTFSHNLKPEDLPESESIQKSLWIWINPEVYKWSTLVTHVTDLILLCGYYTSLRKLEWKFFYLFVSFFTLIVLNNYETTFGIIKLLPSFTGVII